MSSRQKRGRSSSDNAGDIGALDRHLSALNLNQQITRGREAIELVREEARDRYIATMQKAYMQSRLGQAQTRIQWLCTECVQYMKEQPRAISYLKPFIESGLELKGGENMHSFYTRLYNTWESFLQLHPEDKEMLSRLSPHIASWLASV